MIIRNEDDNSYEDNLKPIHEKKGKPKSQLEEDKLMHTILESDKKKIEQGNIIIDAINQGIFAFNPEMMMENMVKDFNLAKQLYGETFLKAVSGYDESTLSRNLKIPEFQRELK